MIESIAKKGPMSQMTKLASPFGWVPAGWQAGLCGVLLIAAVALIVVLARWAAPLDASVENGIRALEMPWTGQRAGKVKDKLAADGLLQLARKNIALDFVFLVVYPLAISLACALLAGALNGPASAIGMMIAWAVLLAGPLDAVEDVAMLRMLAGNSATPWPQLSTICALIKFALVACGLGFVLTGTVMRVVQCWRA